MFLLGEAGLLTGVKCTTHHNLLDDLRDQHPSAQVEANRVFVDDGAILTSAGVTAGFDVILYWLAQRFGTEVSLQVARHMNVYFRRTSHDAALSPWLIARSHMHPAVHRVQDAIAAAPDAAHDLMTLAKIACVSSRHLTRVFKQHTGMTVHDYQIALRHALFEQWRAQGLSQEKAAIAAGFSSANAWRRSKNNESLGV
ncbi:MAG: AraC family transcriptional regulator [Burkholderiaceae bacterium]|nr:AraC family transcriptional regulator [Burkholderiaceae bacterium]